MFETAVKNLYKKKRASAWDHAWKLGFPGRHVESYRKVPLQAVSKFQVSCPGEFRIESNIPKPIVLLSIEEALKTYALFLENRTKARVSRETNFFAALTEAVHEQGFFLYVPPGTVIEEPIPVSFCYEGEGSHFAPHMQVFIGRGAKVAFKFTPKCKSGMVTQLIDMYIDKNSRCDWIENTDLPSEAIYMNAFRATVKEKSKLQLWSATRGAKFFRQDFRVELLEEESEVVLKGASDLSCDNVSHTEVLIQHRAPNAKSRQHFKGVMRDQSSSTFEGKIFVEALAQKTEAYQLNNNLLLGKECTVFSKPNLEIFADDVKASHGATVARLSEEELFYFRTRGIEEGCAGHYLATGFLKEVLYDGV